MQDFRAGVIVIVVDVVVVVVVPGGKQSQLPSFDFDWDLEFDNKNMIIQNIIQNIVTT